MPGLIAEFAHMTSNYATINSPTTCLPWFKQFWPEIDNMQADTVRDMMLTAGEKPWHAKRALEIKDLAGSTSVAKIPTAINQMLYGRVYNVLAYHHTQTKRWAGRGIQIQNFPRVDSKKADNFFDSSKPNFQKLDFNVINLAAEIRNVRPFLKDPVGFCRNILRRIWIADAGMHFYSGDFAKVEPSVLFWFCDLGEIPKKWYEEMAAAIYNMHVHEIGKESDERQVGKTANLQCGYGAGWESFKKKTYKDTGIMLSDEDAKKAVAAYRSKYKVVVQFWKQLEDGFARAIKGDTVSLCGGKLHIMPMEHPWRGVKIRLPSGSYLYYHNAVQKWQQFTEEYAVLENNVAVLKTKTYWKEVIKYTIDLGAGHVGSHYLYGGLLCENVVSATGRDLMVPAMWRLEQAGFDVLGSIHDEIWGQGAPGRAEEFRKIMCVAPQWYTSTIDAEVKEGVRYLK